MPGPRTPGPTAVLRAFAPFRTTVGPGVPRAAGPSLVSRGLFFGKLETTANASHSFCARLSSSLDIAFPETFFPFLFFPSPREGNDHSIFDIILSMRASYERVGLVRPGDDRSGPVPAASRRATSCCSRDRRRAGASQGLLCRPTRSLPPASRALAATARPHKHPRAPRALVARRRQTVSLVICCWCSFRSVGQLHFDAGQRRRARLLEARPGPCSSVSARARLTGMTVSACACSLAPCLLPVQQPNGQQSP